MTTSHKKRVLEITLGTIINLIIFVSIPAFLGTFHHAVTNPLVIAFLLILSIFCIGESWFASNNDESLTPDNGLNPDTILAYITGVIFFLILAFSLCEHLLFATELNFGVYAIGIPIAIIGIYLRISALKELKSAFASLPYVTTGQKLNTRGLYRFVRHPSETGLICITVGMVWMMGSIMGLIMVVTILLPVSYWRVAREECVLRKNFKQDYMDYQNSVPSIFPTLFSKSAKP